ncbi:hinge long tail fiber proximal connector [Aeromonas phage AsFcp_4]|nr:hinge long tail fiber proximal connector [Aeromonas phage AsFcp_4]
MAELVIARVTEQGIQARDLSETFSGDNELIIKGQQGNAGGTCVATLNGVSLSPSQTKGLNCIHLTEDFKTTLMSFDFSVATDTGRFTNWVNSLSTGIILLMSHTENVTNDKLNTYFDVIGSVGWKYYWNPDKGTNRSSYVAIIDCPLKKIMTEQFMGHGKTTMQAQLCVVFDTFADIGVTGYGDMLAWEENEVFVETPGYGVVNYFDTKPQTLNIKPGEMIEINAEVWKSKEAHAAGTGSALIVQFWGDPIPPATSNPGSRYISSFSVNAKGVETWEKGTNSAIVPAACTRIEATLYRYPNKNSSSKIGIRDVMIKLKKPDVKKDRTNGTFGQWGFITANANAADSAANWVASSKGQDLITHSYEELDQEWLPQFNQDGHFDIPDWIPGSKFEISQTISYDYPVNGETWMRSGMGGVTDGKEDRSLKMGIRTINHPDGEAHSLFYAGARSDTKATIEYGRPYTYKIVVDGVNVQFFIDGVEQPKIGTATPFRQVTHFAVGAEKRGNTYIHRIRGSVHELNMIDKTKTNGTNDRYYNFVRPGQLDDKRTVPGKSRWSGIEYFADNVTPDDSANTLYCGAGSKLVPGGLSDDSTDVYVTILDAGGNTLAHGLELNKRYLCRPKWLDNHRLDWVQSQSQFALRNPLSPTSGAWIVEEAGKNAKTMKVRIECVTSPKINGTVTNVDWIDINKQIAGFNGVNQCADIPMWKGPGEFQVKFNYEKTGQAQYVLEGRTSTETDNKYGYIYINSADSINVGGSIVVSTINGMPYTNGMKVVPNTDYLICGYIREGSQVNRIGARYNNIEYFKGYIWDLSFDGSADDRYYKNYNVSRYDAYNNYIRDELGKSRTIYSNVNLNDFSFFTTAMKQNTKSYKFNTATTPSGAVIPFAAKKGSMIRIDFDIETETDFELRYSNNHDGNAPKIKSLSAGRRKGSLCYKVNTDAHGVYIRTISPKLNENVIVYKLNVSEVFTDGIITNTDDSNYKLDERESPVMKTNPRLQWVPKFDATDKGYLHIENAWKPDPKDWAIRVKCKIGELRDLVNPIVSGDKYDTSTINIDTFDAVGDVRLFSYNSKKVLNTGVTVKTGAKVGDIVDIYAVVSGNKVTLTVNGKTVTGAWNPDGTEYIKMIGARETGLRYINDIYLVELIDTTTKLCNSRRYDLSYYSTVKPTHTVIENELGAIKYMRIGEIDVTNKIYGWDGTAGEEKQIGRMKDSWFIDGYQMDLFTTINTSGYSAYLHFVGNKRPFNSIDVELYQIDDNNNEQLFGVYNANQTINATGYGIPESDEVKTWFSGVNTNKKVIFRPKGVGARVSIADAKPWVSI